VAKAYSVGITVVRSGPTTMTVSANYATSDGTAKAGVDYAATAGTVTFSPGVTQQTFLVKILQTASTTSKTVNLTLSAPAGGALLGTPSVASLIMGPSPVTSTTGLVAAYGFNEGSGSTVADKSGNNNAGTIQGATWTAQGRYGSALSFNGTSSRVNIGNSSSLALTSAMTLEAWVNPTTTTSAWRDVIYKGNDAYFLEASSSNGGRPAGGGTLAGVDTWTTGPAALRTNTWSHLALTYDGAMLRLYVNGVPVSSSARTGALATTTNPLQIGGDSVYGQYFQGLIDEVRVYSRALSQTEIQQDMNTPL
jgi:hypothetical protein